MGESTWTTTDDVSSREAIVLHVYGDDDDALRLAAQLGAAATSDEDAKETCLAARSSWSDRHRAVAELLDQRRASDKPRPLVVVDPDLLPADLPADGEARWDDRRFLVARRQVYGLLISHAASTGGVTFVRPRPQPELTSELSAAGIGYTDEPGPPLNDGASHVMPFAQRLARRLVERDVVTEAALVHWVQTTAEPQLSRLVVDAAFEALPSDARAALLQLAVLRGPQPLNGVAGPFTLDGGSELLSLAETAVEALVEAGWLQESGANQIALPSALRAFALRRAKLESDLRPLHARIAAAGIAAADDDEATSASVVAKAIEVHHHAIRSGAAKLALDTARYFVNDVRSLAYELSAEGEYGQAAQLYRAVLDVDPMDAYAHEYYAFNLDKSKQGPPGDEVLAHYDRACQLERDNPLFMGRWLACRVSRGDNVVAELKRYLRSFNQRLGLPAVSYVARAPLTAMGREHRDQVALDWRWLLERDDVLRELL